MYAYLAPIPMSTPDADKPQQFSCRIWFKEAVRVLHERGVIRCPDVDRLETELRLLAEERWLLVEQGVPYKVCESECSS